MDLGNVPAFGGLEEAGSAQEVGDVLWGQELGQGVHCHLQ